MQEKGKNKRGECGKKKRIIEKNFREGRSGRVRKKRGMEERVMKEWENGKERLRTRDKED